MNPNPNFVTPIGWMSPVLIALVFILLTSTIPEPHRRRFMAIMLAGAGSAYLSGGGFGPAEMILCLLVTPCAFLGLESYRFIGVGWLLHTGWDVLHHLYGNPLLPFDPTSALGCAICDPVIAAWCFAGAPSVWEALRARRPEGRVAGV